MLVDCILHRTLSSGKKHRGGREAHNLPFSIRELAGRRFFIQRVIKKLYLIDVSLSRMNDCQERNFEIIDPEFLDATPLSTTNN